VLKVQGDPMTVGGDAGSAPEYEGVAVASLVGACGCNDIEGGSGPRGLDPL